MYPKLLITCCSSSALVNISRNLHQTHYEVLKLNKDCSRKEIRDAYLKLSKQYHPDRSTCTKSHGEFVKISEAYNVLSKPELRRNYDLGLIAPRNIIYDSSNKNGTADDPIFWNNRDRTFDKHYENHPYYGIKGVNRVSNGTIVFCCIILTIVGVLVQFAAINSSATFKREILLKASAENEAIWKKIKEEAEANGPEVQMEKFKKKVENASR